MGRFLTGSSLHMSRLNKTETTIFVSLIFSLLPGGLFLSSLQLVLFCMAALKPLPVHYYSTYYIVTYSRT